MAFQLTVEGFSNGGAIPRRYTCDGENLSPALRWEGAPGNTRSFALIVEDPDAPGGTWNHWLLWNIPGATTSIAEGYWAGRLGTDGANDFRKHGYGGPCPPPGHGAHRYYFKLFALKGPALELPAGARRDQLNRALSGHVLAEAQYMGTYERE
jgi:Raf kinase inhibitor-like YbhB/YbcL family protein